MSCPMFQLGSYIRTINLFSFANHTLLCCCLRLNVSHFLDECQSLACLWKDHALVNSMGWWRSLLRLTSKNDWCTVHSLKTFLVLTLTTSLRKVVRKTRSPSTNCTKQMWENWLKTHLMFWDCPVTSVLHCVLRNDWKKGIVFYLRGKTNMS